MVDRGWCDGVANLRKAIVIIYQVGQTAVTQFGKECHQPRNDISARQPAVQPHLAHLFMRFAAGQYQLLVDLLVDLLTGIVVYVVEVCRFGLVGKIPVRALGPSARLVQDQASRIDFPRHDSMATKNTKRHKN